MTLACPVDFRIAMEPVQMNKKTTTVTEQPATISATPSAEFPMIDLEGSPREVGLSYGRQAGELINRSIEIYKHAFAMKGVSWEQARELAGAFLPRIENYSSDFALELRAIASGAELPIEDLVAINSRTELLYGQKSADTRLQAETDVDGCTAALALPEITADAHCIHGQNWDWRDECSDSSIVLRIHPESGPTILTFVEAGLLARCGMNSAGLGLTGNFLQTDRDFGIEGVPLSFLRRRILMSESLTMAVQSVYEIPRTFSNNLMISQRSGEAVNLETTPHEVFWTMPDEGLLVHANHFTSQGAIAKVYDLGLETNTDSLFRDRRVRSALGTQRGKLTVEDFKRAFSDRFDDPYGVCHPPVRGPGGNTSSTVATVIMDTTQGHMWIAKRPYQKTHFAKYSLA